MATQAAGDAQADHHRDAAGDNPRFRPETFRQRQANGRARGPARQQVGHAPAGSRQQADGGKAREGHVEHAGDHWQHRPQGANEASYQEAGDAITLEIGLGPGDPFRVMAQARQAPDILVKVTPDEVGHDIAQHPGDEPQQQGFAQRQCAAAREHGDGEQQHRAGDDQPGNGQAFHKSHNEHGRGQPLRVCREPSGHAIEPWAHKDNSIQLSKK
ncbi:hypothetical protein D3C73_796240 [compost metagenome]